MASLSAKNLPLFIIEEESHQDILRKVADRVSFPLSQEEQALVETLKYMVQTGLGPCSGLAAPQVGVSKRIIVFHITETALKFRRDAEALLPLTVLMNPSYTPHEEEGQSLDWEPCYSIKTFVGKVYRYKDHYLQRTQRRWTSCRKVARGFLARLLQHEIDHLNGVLMMDLFAPDEPHGTPEEMQSIRLSEISDLQIQS